MSRLVLVPGGMVEAMATLPERRTGLAILSDTYPGGVGAVQVSITGPEDTDGRLAAKVDGILAVVAGRAGCPPLRRLGGSWTLWCRAEHTDSLRAVVLLALRDVTP